MLKNKVYIGELVGYRRGSGKLLLLVIVDGHDFRWFEDRHRIYNADVFDTRLEEICRPETR